MPKIAGTAGAYAFRGGVVFITLLMPALLMCEYGAMLGSSFAGEVVMRSLTYWTWTVAVCFPVVPYLFGVLGVALGRAGLVTGGIVLYAIAVVWQLWVIVLGMLEFADCEGEIHCADNLSYTGVVTGPYGGPTIRFLFIFVATIVMIIAEVIATGVLFSARTTLVIIRSATTRSYAASITRPMGRTSYQDPSVDRIVRTFIRDKQGAGSQQADGEEEDAETGDAPGDAEYS
jgi:hypothetical protein